jgi:hypothetical protein
MASGEEVAGSCLCGQVRFRVRLPTLFCAHCHCSMCRRSHGAGYVTWLGTSREHLSLDAGEEMLKRFRSSDHGTRSFCGRCGSSLFFETTQHAERIDVVLANLHGPIDRAPQAHAYFDCRADWVAVDDDLPRLGGETGIEPLADTARPGTGAEAE